MFADADPFVEVIVAKTPEIKFRVWDADNDAFVYAPSPKFLIGLDGKIVDTNGCACNEHVVQRYTGIRDNTGTEIYEGDILEIGRVGAIDAETSIGYVFYVDEKSAFFVSNMLVGEACNLQWSYIIGGTLVIGNIMQHTIHNEDEGN